MKIKTTSLLLSLCVSAVCVSAGVSVTGCGGGNGTGGTSTASATGAGASSATSTTTTVGSTTTSAGKTSSASTTGSSTGTGGGPPPPPTLGAELDRMGRPAINTALDDEFLKKATGSPAFAASDDTTHLASADAYNAQKDPTMWPQFASTMELQLAILDSLDGTCGNQPAACNDPTKTDCYSTLAGVLADDRLWLKPGAPSCTTYLGVEFKALGATTADDCGGRRPADDVIQTSYTVLSGSSTPIDDGITAPAGLHPTTFPYLAAPN